MSIVTPTAAHSPFVEAWERAETIDGWLSRPEAKLLHQAASDTPKDGFILEIGAFRGKSTEILASVGREMVAIDPMTVGFAVSEDRDVCEDDVEALTEVVRAHDNLAWIRLASHHVDPNVFPLIDLLYIDGEHEGDAAYRDFMHFVGRLNQGASVLFHDFESHADVTQSIKRLEREGLLKLTQQQGSMYLGRFGQHVQQQGGVEPIRVYLAMPHSNDVEPEAWKSSRSCVLGHCGIYVDIRDRAFSILTSNFNKSVIACLNADHYQYLAIHHSDIEASPGWLGAMIRQMEQRQADVMHFVVPLKGDTGETSTAVAFNGDRWNDNRRKLTQYEAHELPEVFDVNDCRRVIHPKIERLLCNTGLLVIRVSEKFKEFPGFYNLDRIERVGESKWIENTVPEDWNFGHWCADNGINVWGMRSGQVVVGHWGRWKFSSDIIWGHKVDPKWAAANGVTQ
jgi:hypothetical protein